MSDMTWLEWPFFDERHAPFAHELDQWCQANLPGIDHPDTDEACRQLVRAMGKAGWLKVAVPSGPDGAWGGRWPQIDSRALCIVREGRVAFIEERPFQPCHVAHVQSPWKTGFCLATKAS